jgi:hypothetical protein
MNSSEPAADLIARESIDVVSPLFCLGIGGYLVFLGMSAFDPTWVPGKGSGRGVFRLISDAMGWLSSHSTPTVTGITVVAVGAMLLLVALLLTLNAIYWRDLLLIVDAAGIESLSGEGKGRLAWKEVSTVRVVDGVLRVNGTSGRDISVAIGEVDKSRAQILAAISRYRHDALSAAAGGAG